MEQWQHLYKWPHEPHENYYSNFRAQALLAYDEVFNNEGEKVKNIDFAKPIRGSFTKEEMTVVQEGLTVVRYADGRGQYMVIDEKGHILGGFKNLFNAGPRVENVPEEPKDHILLFKSFTGEWEIYADGDGKTIYYTKAQAEMYAANRTFFVKVPV